MIKGLGSVVIIMGGETSCSVGCPQPKGTLISLEMR
jgi:hypothetical protein